MPPFRSSPMPCAKQPRRSAAAATLHRPSVKRPRFSAPPRRARWRNRGSARRSAASDRCATPSTPRGRARGKVKAKGKVRGKAEAKGKDKAKGKAKARAKGKVKDKVRAKV